MTPVTLKIDIKNGTIEIQAAPEDFDNVVTRASEILSRIAPSGSTVSASRQDSSKPIEARDEDATAASETVKPAKEKARGKRSPGSGKVKDVRIIDDLLSQENRKELRAFVEEKKPSTQNELVAVLAVKLKQFTGRNGFTADEIHTAVQAIGQKTPANLKAVFGNMTAASLGKQDDGKFIPNFKCDDLVNHDLPPKMKTKNG